MLTARSDDQNPYARLTPAAADQLGIGEITLLVIRPDGHVGLRADRDHIEALAAYHTLLVSAELFSDAIELLPATGTSIKLATRVLHGVYLQGECSMTAGGAEDNKPGQRLLEELKWVHEQIRHDLRVCEELAQRVSDGLSPADVRTEIRSLQTDSPLWRLRVNCLYYCRFVHAHHTAEDIALFPALRASNPDLVGVVDKLETDHRTVSDQLHEVEASADALLVEDALHARARLVTALDNLQSDLLAHLNYEEESIGPAILEWERWPLH